MVKIVLKMRSPESESLLRIPIGMELTEKSAEVIVAGGNEP